MSAKTVIQSSPSNKGIKYKNMSNISDSSAIPSPGVWHKLMKSRWNRRVGDNRSKFDWVNNSTDLLRGTKDELKFLSFVYSSRNLGDEIQTIAQMNYIPQSAKVAAIDRELTNCYGGEHSFLISNGWFMHNLAAWPPSELIEPIFTSFHLANAALLDSQNIDYFKRHGPVGCRDIWTVRLFEKHGIDAYFSGCLTLSLNNPFESESRNDQVVICDAALGYDGGYPPSADSLFRQLVPARIIERALRVSHEVSGFRRHDYVGKFLRARRLLDLYARAKLVITTRLHCALPCIALGTPVIFLHQRYETEPRFEGLREILRGYGPSAGKIMIDWDNPEAIDVTDLKTRIRADTLQKVADTVEKSRK